MDGTSTWRLVSTRSCGVRKGGVGDVCGNVMRAIMRLPFEGFSQLPLNSSDF